MSSRHVFVFGITGTQGKAVALAMRQGGWQVTGLTRNKDGQVALALARQGIRIVQGDLLDPQSYVAQLPGHSAAFINTDLFGILGKNGGNVQAAVTEEVDQGIQAVKACHEAGIPHIVYSALEDFPGEHSVPFCASKAQIASYIRDNNIPATNVYTSTYYSAFINNGWIVRDRDTGGLKLQIPVPDNTLMSCVEIERLGDWVLPILNNPQGYIDKDVTICGDNLTVAEMAETLHRITGKPVGTLKMSEESFYSDETKSAVGPVLYPFLRANYEGLVKRDVESSAVVNPSQRRFADWATSNQALLEGLQ